MVVPPLPTFTGMLTILPGLALVVPLAVPPFGVLLVAGSFTILPMPPLLLVVWVGAGRVTILPGACDGVPFCWLGWLLPAGRLMMWPPLPSLPMPLLSPDFCTIGKLPFTCAPPLPCCSGMYLGWPRLPILKVGAIFCGARNLVACIKGICFGCIWSLSATCA